MSLNVKVSDEAEARLVVRAALRGLIELDADDKVGWMMHARRVKDLRL